MSDLIEKLLTKVLPHFDIVKDVEGQETLYLRRFHIFRSKRCNVYLHRFHRSDEDPDPHDHPWDFTSIILSKGYVNERWDFLHTDNLDRAGHLSPDPFNDAHLVGSRNSCYGMRIDPAYEEFKAGDIIWHAATHLHRVILRPGEKPWTLVITGPERRTWGFVQQRAWVYWREYLNVWNNNHA